MPPPTPHRSALADHPAVREILPVFIGGLPTHVRQLREFLAAGNAPALRQLAHRLRGAGKSYGFAEISTLSENIDVALQAAQPIESTRRAVEALIAYMQNIEAFPTP